jgi:hypothetical protein
MSSSQRKGGRGGKGAGAHSHGSLNDTEAPIEHSIAALSVGSVGSDTHSQVHQLADLDGHKHDIELYEEALKRSEMDVGRAYESYFVNEAQTESLKESATPHPLSLHFLALVRHARSIMQVAGKMRARRTRNRRLPRRATSKRIRRLRPAPPRPFPARPPTRRDLVLRRIRDSTSDILALSEFPMCQSRASHALSRAICFCHLSRRVHRFACSAN